MVFDYVHTNAYIQYMNPDKRKNGIPMIPFISGAGIIIVIISDFILKL